MLKLSNLAIFKYYHSFFELVAYLSIIYFGDSVVDSTSLNGQIEASIVQIFTNRNFPIYFHSNYKIYFYLVFLHSILYLPCNTHTGDKRSNQRDRKQFTPLKNSSRYSFQTTDLSWWYHFLRFRSSLLDEF